MSASLQADYFEMLYAADPDPWNLETSEYEDAKYTATIAALGARRFTARWRLGAPSAS